MQPFVQSLKDVEYRVAVVGPPTKPEAFPSCTSWALNGGLVVQNMANHDDWYGHKAANDDAVEFFHVHNIPLRAELIEVAKLVRTSLCSLNARTLATASKVFMRVDIGHLMVEHDDASETSCDWWIINECDNTMLHADIMVDMVNNPVCVQKPLRLQHLVLHHVQLHIDAVFVQFAFSWCGSAYC